MPAPIPVHPHRLVYLGTPAAAVAPLVALVDAGYEILTVVSGSDRRRGRGGARMASPVKAAALDLGLAVTDRVDDVAGTGADLGVVVAFGQIIRAAVLDVVPMVNLHFSALPRWRGAAPVERAILAGDQITAVAVMAVDETLDTGDVFAETSMAIGPDETADELRARLVEAGTSLLLTTLAAGLTDPRPQRGEVTYAAKIDAAELELDWSRPAAELHRRVRIGGAWTTWRGHRLKVWRSAVETEPPEAMGPAPIRPLDPGELDGLRVGTGQGQLTLVEVQPEGKVRQDAAAWRRGARPGPGERLGNR